MATRTSPWVWVALGVLATLGLLAFLLFVAGARLDAATAGLVVAAATLVYCLRSLFQVVRVLAQPDLQRELDPAIEGVAGVVVAEQERELREERRRLLRAIHELEFDFQMGKLSEGDYRSVRQGYELRAIEVIRALETETHLHPDLVAELREGGLLDEGELERVGGEATDAAHPGEITTEVEPSTTTPSAPRETVASDASDSDPGLTDASQAPAGVEATPAAESKQVCAQCSGANDLDARFCKHCGRELAA